MPASAETRTWPEHDKRALPNWALVALGVLLTVVWAAIVWSAPRTTVTPELRLGANFVHVAAMLVGFGGVLTVDWLALMWLLRRRTLSDLLKAIDAVHTMVWAGLAGVVFSGLLLQPDVGSTLTQAKLGLVLIVLLNGLQAHALGKRLRRYEGHEVPTRVMLHAGITGAVSQLGWWGCVLIGFINTH